MNELNQPAKDNGHNEARELIMDQIRMLEINEAIRDLDSKLTDLEIALHLDRKK